VFPRPALLPGPRGRTTALPTSGRPFLAPMPRRQERVANQVPRETEWLAVGVGPHRPEISVANPRKRAGGAAMFVADLHIAPAGAGASGIDFRRFPGAGDAKNCSWAHRPPGENPRRGGRPFSGARLALAPGRAGRAAGPNGSAKKTTPSSACSPGIESKRRLGERAKGWPRWSFEPGTNGPGPPAALSAPLFAPELRYGSSYRDRPVGTSSPGPSQFLFPARATGVPVGDLVPAPSRPRVADRAGSMLRPGRRNYSLTSRPTTSTSRRLEVVGRTVPWPDFPGPSVLVSHDRELLDRLCTE